MQKIMFVIIVIENIIIIIVNIVIVIEPKSPTNPNVENQILLNLQSQLNNESEAVAKDMIDTQFIYKLILMKPYVTFYHIS